MNREIIFNFISQNRSFFKEIDLNEMTICLFGEIFNDSLTKNILKEEQLYLYHVKLPRMYYKTKSINLLGDGILSFASSIDTITKFSYEDFSFKLIEPFYEKDIREFNFRYFYIIPIFSKGSKVGVIFAYANNNTFSLKMDNLSLSKLAINLTNDTEESLQKEIKMSIINQDISNVMYFIVDSLNKRIVYSSSIVKAYNSLEIESYEENPLELKLIKELSQEYDLIEKPFSASYSNLTLYYFEKFNNLNEILYYKTFKLKKSNSFMIFVDGFEYVKKILKAYKNNNLAAYGYKDNYYFIVFDNNKLVNDVSLFIKELKSSNVILIKDLSFISKDMNLDKFFSYLAIHMPKDFDVVSFKQYLLNIGEEEYKVSKEKLASNSIFYHGSSYLVINKPVHKLMFDESIKASINQICLALKKHLDSDSLVISLLPEMIESRKIKELFKKLINLNKNIIIVLSNYNDDYHMVLNAYSIIKQCGFKLFVDTSIVTNFKMFNNITLIDGVYVKQKEFEIIQSSKESLVNTLISYLFKENKEIIFEETLDKSKNNLYKNNNIFFVKNLLRED